MVCLISVLVYNRKTGGNKVKHLGVNKVKHLGVIIKFLVDKTWSSPEPSV